MHREKGTRRQRKIERKRETDIERERDRVREREKGSERERGRRGIEKRERERERETAIARGREDGREKEAERGRARERGARASGVRAGARSKKRVGRAILGRPISIDPLGLSGKGIVVCCSCTFFCNSQMHGSRCMTSHEIRVLQQSIKYAQKGTAAGIRRTSLTQATYSTIFCVFLRGWAESRTFWASNCYRFSYILEICSKIAPRLGREICSTSSVNRLGPRVSANLIQHQTHP